MKRISLFFSTAFLLVSQLANSQTVGISDVTFSPNTQAVLDLSSDRRGFLPPRLELNGNDLPISGTKPAGLIVYNQGGAVGPNGFYYWTGSTWTQIATTANTVDGAGTLNYAARWTPDGSTLGIGVIQDDGSNVGISATPDANVKLNLNGRMSMNDNDIRFRGPTDANHLIGYRSTFAGAAMNGVLLMGYANGVLGTNVSGDKISLFWNSNNQVGVNTSAPATNLNVYNNNESATQTNFTQAINNSGMLITTEYTNGAYTPGLFWNTTNDNATMPKAGIYLQTSTLGSKMIFGTSTTYASGITNSAMVIDDLGNVGVGTTIPRTVMHVTGNGGAFNLEGTDHAYIQYYPDGIAAGRKAYLGYPNATSNDLTIANEISGGKLTLNTNSGNIIANSLAGSGTRFVVADVNGNLTATSSTASGVVTGSGTTNYLARWTPNGATLGAGVVQDDGSNAGVGVAPNANVKLNVGGNLALNDGDLRLRPATDPNHLLGYRNSWGGTAMDGPLLMGHQSGILGTNNGGDKIALFWNNSQRVGVGGMTAPFSALHINSNGAYATTGNMASGLIVSNSTGGTAVNLGTYDAGQYGYLQSAYVNSAGTVRTLALNPNGGNVGIGTTAPIQNLDVNGRIHINNGVLQRGGAAITATNDLGLYSRVNGNWIRIVTNNAPVRFFSDDNTGTSTNVSVEAAGQLYAQKGFRTERHIRFYKRSRGNGQGGVDNLGNYDFCYLGGVAFRNSDSVSDEDDDYQCNVYSQDINGSADYNEGENEDFSANFDYTTRPYWRMYSECYQDCSNSTCTAICINFDY